MGYLHVEVDVSAASKHAGSVSGDTSLAVSFGSMFDT